MFTFHKPRVYRSTEGCCICRAKSSSSRFTDSKKYENDSVKCFDLKQARYGEICNACVLLVKRYKRLPVGSNRHWGHVVDARAGPGTKSLTKHKRQRDEMADCNGTSGNNSHGTYNGKSLIGEKFSKIYKKNKKLKANLSTSPSCNSKRKSTNSSSSHTWDNPNHPNQQSLPSTPDSLDSDYEDSHMAGHSGTVVEFQTQTRASAYRSLNRKSLTAAGCVNSSSAHRKHAVGSLRRKCMPPRKLNRAIIENNVQFFDENEWQKRHSCCGPVYECRALGGALILDLEFYRPCAEHQNKSIKKELQPTPIHNPQTLMTSSYPQHYHQQQQQQQQQHQQQQLQKTIIANMSSETTTKPNQVLKKHHLFFKRQSECFPHTDLSAINTANHQIITTSLTSASSTTTTAPATKTDLPISVITSTTGTKTLPSSSSFKTSADLTTTTNLSISTSNLNTMNIISSPITSRHSMAKISLTPSTTTTIVGNSNININKSNKLNINNNSNTNTNTNNKSTSFLHKIKATTTDTGKISKHSLDKLSTAVRLMPGDLNDMRHIIKTVDKSYLLNKHQQPVVVPPPVSHHHHISIVGPSQQGTIPNTAKLSPTCTSSLAPKFSDNSSDSGFDENLQDRKSVSPLQEDTEIKMLTRPSIPNGKKIFSTAGVNSYCPAQSMLLQPGIEEAIKLRQQYRQQHTTIPTTSSHQRNNRTSSVKIAQIVGGNNNNHIMQHNSGVSQKMHMRSIYNNNTIKHENGVTTIVPASSLAASSQTAAMSALVAPNTVTITPSPAATATSIHNHAAGIKVGLGSIPGGGGGGAASPPASNTTTTHLTTINNNLPNLNQKIIFLKTAKYSGNNNNNHNNNTNINNNATSIATALHHNANNNYHSTTMMNTTTTAVATTTIPKPQSMQQQQQVSAATTLSSVLKGHNKVCV